MKKENYQMLINMSRIGSRAVNRAQEENRQLGLPNVYSKNKKLYYELPDGTFTSTQPQIFAKTA